jgi:hypothetical protein
MSDKNRINKTGLKGIEDLDTMISTHVRAIQYKIPASVEEKVNAAILKKGKKNSRFSSKPLLWLRVSVTAAAAALVLIAAIVIFQPLLTDTDEPVSLSPITEIKTEFELSDKNIKILWVQKKDFELKIKN